MAQDMVESKVDVRGLHYAVFKHAAQQDKGNLPVVLCHGFLDTGRAFAPVAQMLSAERDVFCFDWRGHGDSDWVTAGGFYHFMDYVADLDALLVSLGINKCQLIGHSMGGVVSTYFTAVRSTKIDKLVNIEGLGIPGASYAEASARLKLWLDGLQAEPRKQVQMYDTIEAMEERLARQHPLMSQEQIREYAAILIQGDEHVGYTWKFDPLHRLRNPYPFYEEAWMEFAKLVHCPVLYVDASRSNFSMDINHVRSRYEAFSDASHATIANCGHMIHLNNPDDLGQTINEFLDG